MMKNSIIKIFVVFMLVAVLSAGSFAQDATPARQSGTTEDQDKVMLPDEDADSDQQVGGYVYNPMGRRDPFWSLLRGRKRGPDDRKDGIEGLAIAELTLEGIMKMEGKYTALFRGPDNFPYTVQVGQMVYDGEITKIDDNIVHFKQIFTFIGGRTKEKIIKKKLNPEEGGD